MGTRSSSGFVVWFTGLPAAGKTTIASGVAERLRTRGRAVEQLDGDAVRARCSPSLGYTKKDRAANVAQIARDAAEAARGGTIVLVSVVSPYEDARSAARETVQAVAPFFEVHVATPLEECARRDPKGLYAAARAGKVSDFTGISAPYEQPSEPELRLDTTDLTPEQCVSQVIACLERGPAWLVATPA